MRMKIFPAFVLFAISVAACADGNANKPIKVELSWRLALDAHGQVTQLEAAKNELIDHVPQIRERLEQEIRGWKFSAGTVDGEPADTETGLHINATLIPTDADRYVIRVEHASIGARLAKVVPPHYPPSAVSGHKTGAVILRIGYDAAGKVTSAVLDPDAPKAHDVLVKAAIKAVQTWTFQPELVGGHGVAGFAITPFCYQLMPVGTHRVEGTCDWQRPGTSETVNEGEALALNPVAHLQTEVAGRTL